MSENNHEQLETELESLLEKVFAADTQEYRKRGFKRRVGCPRGVPAAGGGMASGKRRNGHRTMTVTGDCTSAWRGRTDAGLTNHH